VPPASCPRITLEEAEKRTGEWIEIEFVVKSMSSSPVQQRFELYSGNSDWDPGCVIVSVEALDKSAKDKEFKALEGRYKNHRIRVRGLVQAKQYPNGTRPLVEVWDAARVEVLP
jgi:hypothetical protein